MATVVVSNFEELSDALKKGVKYIQINDRDVYDKVKCHLEFFKVHTFTIGTAIGPAILWGTATGGAALGVLGVALVAGAPSFIASMQLESAIGKSQIETINVLNYRLDKDVLWRIA